MSALFIILLHPFVKISLQFLNAAVDLLAKGDAVELIQQGFVETLADAVGLRATRFCPRVVDILNGQIELIFMPIMGAAEFRATIRQNTIDTQAMLVKERYHPIIEQIGGRQRCLAIIELGETHLRVGINPRLLIDPAYTFQGANIETILRNTVARMFAFKFPMGFLVGLRLLQRDQLGFGQDAAFLGHFRLKGLQALFHGLKIMAQPDAAHAKGRDFAPTLLQFIRRASLAPSGLFNRYRNYSRLDFRGYAVLQVRLGLGNLNQRQLTAFLVQVAETIKTVPRITHHTAGLGHAAQLLGQFQQPNLGLDHFAFTCRHHTSPGQPAGALRYAYGSAPRPLNPPKV